MYNEEEVAAQVIAEIQNVLDKEAIDYEIVAVNNGSRDKTGEILEQLQKKDARIHPCTVPVNKGYSWGIVSGLKEARGNILGYSDGDGQVDPQDIVRVYKKRKETNAVLCKGTRHHRGDGWKRIVASKGYNLLFAALFGLYLNDVNGKPKIFTRDFYNSITIDSKDYFIDAEIILKLRKQGHRPEEVPVSFDKRSKGKSTVSYNTVVEFFKNLVKWRMQSWKK